MSASREIQLTDALRRLAKDEAMYAYDFKGHRYDVGTKSGKPAGSGEEKERALQTGA